METNGEGSLKYNITRFLISIVFMTITYLIGTFIYIHLELCSPHAEKLITLKEQSFQEWCTNMTVNVNGSKVKHPCQIWEEELKRN